MMRAIGRGVKRAPGLLAFAVAMALAADPLLAQAQQSPAPAAAPAPAETAAPAPAATPALAEAEQPPENSAFTREELEKLLAPIALYPDPLLAQMLPASAYPVQIVQAQRWLDKNKALVAKNDYSGIDNQNWDPCGEGARALSRRYQADERRSRLDDGPRRRRSEPAAGRCRRHPGASRERRKRPGRSRRRISRRSNAWRRARRQWPARLRGRQRRKPRRAISPSSRPIRRPSMSRPMIRLRSISPIPGSRLFWVSEPASRSGRCGTITTGIGEQARSTRRSGPAIRAGMAPSTTATSTSATTSISATSAIT